MNALYRWLLSFYPPRYRCAFADEMLDVFLQANADAARRGVPSRVALYAREVSGLLGGAAREHLRALGEARGWKFLAQGGPMIPRERRYPYTSIVFMSLALGVIVATIAKAQGIARYVYQIYTVNGHTVIETRQHSDFGNSIAQWPTHWGLVSGIVVGFLIAWAAGLAAWGIVHALRRSGVQRLDEVQTWPAK